MTVGAFYYARTRNPDFLTGAEFSAGTLVVGRGSAFLPITIAEVPPVPPPAVNPARKVTARLGASISSELRKTLDLSTGVTAAISAGFDASLVGGTAAWLTDRGRAWGDTRTLAASASENLDLLGPLLDAFSDPFDPNEILGMIILADAGNVNDIIVGGAATNQFVGPLGAATHTHRVRPGGAWLWYAPAPGLPLLAAADLRKVANAGGSTAVTYSIVLVGRLA